MNDTFSRAGEVPSAEPSPVSYKRPESVLVIVYTQGGEALMMQRTRPVGFWQSVTGSLRWGESARSAATRELFEETGLLAGGTMQCGRRSVLFPIKPAWRTRYHPSVRFNREHWFYLPLTHRRLVRLNASEHSSYCWLPIRQAAALATSWTNREALLRLLR